MFSGGFFGGPNALDTTVSESKEKTVRRLQNIVPVCVRQLLACNGDDFVLFGMKAQIISLVCILREYEVSSTKVTYKLEDHTGQISAILWLESDNNGDPSLPPVKEGHYMRIYGSLRIMEGVKTVLVLKTLPVTGPNQVTTHLLEVIRVRYEAESMLKSGDNSIARISQKNPGAALKNSMVYEADVESMNHGFTPLQTKVYNIFKNSKSSTGLSRDSVRAQFPSTQRKEIDAAIDYMASEGHIYSTIDPEHFIITDQVD